MRLEVTLSMKSHRVGERDAIRTKYTSTFPVDGNPDDVDQHALQESIVAKALEQPDLEGYSSSDVTITECSFVFKETS